MPSAGNTAILAKRRSGENARLRALHDEAYGNRTISSAHRPQPVDDLAPAEEFDGDGDDEGAPKASEITSLAAFPALTPHRLVVNDPAQLPQFGWRTPLAAAPLSTAGTPPRTISAVKCLVQGGTRLTAVSSPRDQVPRCRKGEEVSRRGCCSPRRLEIVRFETRKIADDDGWSGTPSREEALISGRLAGIPKESETMPRVVLEHAGREAQLMRSRPP